MIADQAESGLTAFDLAVEAEQAAIIKLFIERGFLQSRTKPELETIASRLIKNGFKNFLPLIKQKLDDF